MKKNFVPLLIIVVAISFTSCKKDFLDVNNTQNLFRESYVKDLTSMQEYLNGAYVLMGYYFEEGQNSAYPELVADNLRPQSTSIGILMSHYNWVQVAGVQSMDGLWEKGYSIIRGCNFAVEEVDNYRSENPAKADYIKGQALGIRAYIFFKLVNTFAQAYNFTSNASHPGIPYITSSDITEPFSRQTVAEVYNGMIADLAAAIEILPANVSDIRFMNQSAAKALLARVYLFKEDFANAKSMASEVIGKTPLMTIADGYPDDIFKFKSPSQTETLFQLSPEVGQVYYTLWVNYYLRSTQLTFLATSDVVNLLQENPDDARKAWVTDVSGEWNVTKFPLGVAPEVPNVSSIPELAYYPPIIRSSEMYLTVAEAAARLSDENAARTHLDAVRKRADPSASATSAAGTALLNLIYKERRKELAFESLRMYDLQRWKSPVTRTDVLPGSPANLPYPSEKAIAPIPLSDVRLAKIPQNQGY